jgi:hypothetical protein
VGSCSTGTRTAREVGFFLKRLEGSGVGRIGMGRAEVVEAMLGAEEGSRLIRSKFAGRIQESRSLCMSSLPSPSEPGGRESESESLESCSLRLRGVGRFGTGRGGIDNLGVFLGLADRTDKGRVWSAETGVGGAGGRERVGVLRSTLIESPGTPVGCMNSWLTAGAICAGESLASQEATDGPFERSLGDIHMALMVGEADGARHGVLGLENLDEEEVGLEGSEASPTPVLGGGSGGSVCARGVSEDPASPMLTVRPPWMR